MTEILAVIVQLSGMVFVVASMFAMGLNLTIPKIIQPLKNVKLLILALVANFILVPVAAYAIIAVMARISSFSEANSIAFILLATAAGAPFLPKLAQLAKGNLAYTAGLMTLLMIATTFYLPIVLPLALPGVAVDSWAIAKSLVGMMLVPMGIGLFIRARYEEAAQHLQPTFGQAANTALMIMMGVLLVMNFKTILDFVGTGVIVAGIVFFLISVVIGYIMAFGAEGDVKRVMALGTGQSNVSAAFVVAVGNFADNPDVIVTLIVLIIIDLVILLPLAGEMGKRMGGASGQATESEVAS